ncbi:MAG: GrpB family protein [Thermomicrobiales bacterium]
MVAADDLALFGLGRREVRLVPHDPRWSVAYCREAERLQQALGAHALEIAHIGSTAVPGLVAKPLLDIMVAITSLEEQDEVVPLLERIGYEFRLHDTLPERLFFITGEPEARRVNLSLTALDSAYWRDHLAFRDILRGRPDMADAYARLKAGLAERYSDDRLAYTAAKGEFVARALAADRVQDG